MKLCLIFLCGFFCCFTAFSQNKTTESKTNGNKTNKTKSAADTTKNSAMSRSEVDSGLLEALNGGFQLFLNDDSRDNKKNKSQSLELKPEECLAVPALLPYGGRAKALLHNDGKLEFIVNLKSEKFSELKLRAINGKQLFCQRFQKSKNEFSLILENFPKTMSSLPVEILTANGKKLAFDTPVTRVK